jgi:DNA replication protein DnaC
VSDLEPLEGGTRRGRCPGPYGAGPCPDGAEVPVFELAGSVFTARCPACQEADELREREEERAARLASCRRELARRLPEQQRAWSLESFADGVDEADLEARDAVLAWLGEYLSGDRHGLYLHGDVGRGKTGLAVGLARELAEGAVEAWVVNWRDWLARLRDSYSDASRRPEPLEPVEVLVLDDLGAERPTDHARQELATVVERRYGARLATVATSNMRPTQLARALGHDDPVVGQRIVSRLTDDATIVEVRGRQRRGPRGWLERRRSRS